MPQRPVHNTYGAGLESDITAFEALLSEVRRCHAAIVWLEGYVAKLPEWAVFEDTEVTWGTEAEVSRMGRPQAQPGTLKYMLQVERQKQLNGGRRKAGVHPAVQQLLKERQQLVNVCTSALRVGVALDQIELAKRQGAMLFQAMRNFALATGQDIDDPGLIDKMTAALDQAMVMVDGR